MSVYVNSRLDMTKARKDARRAPAKRRKAGLERRLPKIRAVSPTITEARYDDAAVISCHKERQKNTRPENRSLQKPAEIVWVRCKPSATQAAG